MTELGTKKEKAEQKAEYQIVVARHAEYSGVGEDVPEDNRGWLTEEGIEQSKELAKNILESVKFANKPVDVLVINSPTAAEDNKGRLFGKRAEQTARVVMDELKVLAKNLPDDGLRVLGSGAGDGPAEALYHQDLTEPNIHYVEGAENPRAYFEAQVEEFGKAADPVNDVLGRKEGYLRGNEVVDAIAREIGAETAEDVGAKTLRVVKDVDQLAAYHAEASPDRYLVVVLLTHDDNLRSLLQYQMGAGEDAHDYLPSHAEALIFKARDGKITTNFNDHEYSLEI